MERAFFQPLKTEHPNHFRLDVTKDVLVGPPERQFLMGGVGLGSAICAMEWAADRPLIWAAAQFLSSGAPADVIEIDVELLVVGGKVTQARSTSKAGDKVILTVTASLGGRDDRPTVQIAKMPKVAAPDTCDNKPSDFPSSDDMQRRFEKRTAYQSDEEGVERLWFRPTHRELVTPGLLAIIADFLAGGHSQAAGSSSLDNTLRIHNIVQTEWILLDTHFTGFASGAFHGHTHLFAQDGTLLATAGQTGMMPKLGNRFR